jgi:hypothetical protein
MGSRAPGDQHEVLTAGGPKEQFDRTLGLPRLEERTGQIHGCLGRVEALVEICAEVEGLVRRGERERHVPCVQRCRGAAKEGPYQRMRVAEQACPLDATVEQFAGFGELSAQAPEAAQGRGQCEQELALAGRARHVDELELGQRDASSP